MHYETVFIDCSLFVAVAQQLTAATGRVLSHSSPAWSGLITDQLLTGRGYVESTSIDKDDENHTLATLLKRGFIDRWRSSRTPRLSSETLGVVILFQRCSVRL